MRERSGTRTEHARRTHLRHPLATTVTTVATGLATGVGLVAPAGAAPATPGEPVGPGTAARPVPVSAGTAGVSAPETDVEEVDVPRSRGPEQTLPDEPGLLVAASLDEHATEEFAMVGVTWREGTAPEGVEVQVRTRGETGWTRWRHLEHHPTEGPAPGEEPGVIRDGTQPLWVGEGDAVEARILSDDGTAPADPQLTLVDPGIDPSATAPAVSTGGSGAVRATPVATGSPRMVSRRGWGADPRLRSRCDTPRRARTVKMAFVHHTAGSNSYSRSESPAIVRSIYAYHTQGHGWCDIGYNFLVDRYGTVFVGRAGGPNTPVRGAHTGAYNERSVGVSLMGNFENAGPTRAMKRGLTRLLAWKLSSYYRYPRTRTRLEGRRFEKISGHRDAMSTACPGRHVYGWLPELRRRVARRAGEIDTPISHKWERLRSHGTNLGQPFKGESTAAGTGRKTKFGTGWIFWRKGPGAHPVWGRIYRRWHRYGLANGRLGYPSSDIRELRGYRGAAQTYQRGRIYRTPRYGTNAVWGRVNIRYRRLGSARGRLGLPVRNQVQVRNGWEGRFQHGRIIWNTSTGRVKTRYYR